MIAKQTYKTTIDFDKDLYFQLKMMALNKGKTVKELIEYGANKVVEEESKRVRVRKKIKDGIPKGFKFKKMIGTFRREETYDFI